jgi:hypothetical protein
MMIDLTYDSPLSYTDTFDCTNVSTDVFSCARSFLFKRQRQERLETLAPNADIPTAAGTRARRCRPTPHQPDFAFYTATEMPFRLTATSICGYTYSRLSPSNCVYVNNRFVLQFETDLIHFTLQVPSPSACHSELSSLRDPFFAVRHQL